VTVAEQVDETTGQSHKVVVESKDPAARPRVSIKGEDGETVSLHDGKVMARYLLPVGAIIVVAEGQEIKPGDILAKVNREASRTKDITGGLPRVAELFEASKPKDLAVISEVDGFVSFGKDTKGKRMVLVAPDVGEPREYLIPKGGQAHPRARRRLRAGRRAVDGWGGEPARHPQGSG
jgi:DNA-directed RNA polymerase subunit beta'